MTEYIMTSFWIHQRCMVNHHIEHTLKKLQKKNTDIRRNRVMQVIDTAIADVKILKPQDFGDNRGWFMESWSKKKMEEAGFEPTLRMNKDGSIYETNNHNYILDTKYTNTKFGKDYAAMEAFLKGTLGVLETGFFLNRTDIIISAGEDGITTIENPNK